MIWLPLSCWNIGNAINKSRGLVLNIQNIFKRFFNHPSSCEILTINVLHILLNFNGITGFNITNDFFRLKIDTKFSEDPPIVISLIDFGKSYRMTIIFSFANQPHVRLKFHLLDMSNTPAHTPAKSSRTATPATTPASKPACKCNCHKNLCACVVLFLLALLGLIFKNKGWKVVAAYECFVLCLGSICWFFLLKPKNCSVKQD